LRPYQISTSHADIGRGDSKKLKLLSHAANPQEATMAVLTVRNIPDEAHRALRVRATKDGRSTEAEVREILQSVVKPAERVKLGSLIHEIGRRAKLTDQDVDALEATIRAGRHTKPQEPMSFE
jgi:antitoxin FitA